MLKVLFWGWFPTLRFVVIGGGDYMFTDSTIRCIIGSYKTILFWELVPTKIAKQIEVIIFVTAHVLPLLLECFSV